MSNPCTNRATLTYSHFFSYHLSTKTCTELKNCTIREQKKKKQKTYVKKFDSLTNSQMITIKKKTPEEWKKG